MTTWRRKFFPSALAVLPSLIAALAEDAAPFNRDEARAVVAMMEKDPPLLDLFAVCPADIFRRDAPFWERWLGRNKTKEKGLESKCADNPAHCFALCTQSGVPEACFHLAIVFQKDEDTVAPRFAEALFSKACALGHGGGCTNRASYIRNVADPDDPLRKRDASAQSLCTFRSFKLDCDADGAWGCAMLGQAHRLGESVTQNAFLARKFYEKSCTLSPNFVACDFSKRALKAMTAE